MRAKLRSDLLEVVPWSDPIAPGWTRLEMFARTYAGKTLEVVNVTQGIVTLRLSRTDWMHDGDAVFGITTVSVPHIWLETDIKKDEFHASTRLQNGAAAPAVTSRPSI